MDSDTSTRRRSRAPRPTSALRWSWGRLRATPGTIIGASATWALILLAGLLGVFLTADWIVGSIVTHILRTSTDARGALDATIAVQDAQGYLESALWLVPVSLSIACWLNGAIVIADGRRPVFTDFFRPTALAPVLSIVAVTGLLTAGLEALFVEEAGFSWTYLVCVAAVEIPATWMYLAAADCPRASLRAGVAEGFTLLCARPGATIVMLTVTLVVLAVGVLFLGVGLLVALPLTEFLAIYYFRTLTGRSLAP
ncbi:hypothetical protein [Gordonia iterans]